MNMDFKDIKIIIPDNRVIKGYDGSGKTHFNQLKKKGSNLKKLK